jgi:hypothetical protein
VAEDALYHELVRLRRGSALQGNRLPAKIGPHLAAACGINGRDSDHVIRQKVSDLVRRHSADFPPDLLLAIDVALGTYREARFLRLADREQWLADRLYVSLRSARRRVADACARLAEVVRESAGQDLPDDPEQGWYVTRLRSMLCLDTPQIELLEERTVVATRDDLGEIRTRFSLPESHDGTRGGGAEEGERAHHLITEVLHGARLKKEERLGRTHFRHLLGLPKSLRSGQEHSYAIRYRIPPGQPMRPHLAFTPLNPCRSFTLRVRFDPRRPPEVVWRLDQVAPRLLDEPQPGAVAVRPDDAGDISLDFADLRQGYGYGAAWRFAHPDAAERPQ